MSDIKCHICLEGFLQWSDHEDGQDLCFLQQHGEKERIPELNSGLSELSSLCESEVAAILHTEVDWVEWPETSCQAEREYLRCLWKLSGSRAESEKTNKWRWQYAGLERARHGARVSRWRSPLFGLFNETSSRKQTQVKRPVSDSGRIWTILPSYRSAQRSVTSL